MAALVNVERLAIDAAAGVTLAADERFLCMGPFCYGYGQTAKEAIQNAGKNRVRIYEGKAGWRFLLFVARKDVVVDDMGAFCWTFRDGEDDNSPKPYREVYRTPNMPVRTDGDIEG